MTITLERAKVSKNGHRLLQVTYRDLDPYFSHSNGDHDVYVCPICPELGKSVEDTKLYINNSKKIGYCFRCETVFVFEESYNLEIEVKEFLKQTKKSDKKKPDKKFDVLSWTNPITEPCQEVENYLKTQRAYQHPTEILDRFSVRWSKIKDKILLVFPNSLDENGLTDFFQYKVLGDAKKYVSVGPPPIMWLDLYKSTIILVEGVFDGIAAFGCPICGKTLSEYQKSELREKCLNSDLRKVILLLDGEISEEKMQKKAESIKSLVSGQEVCYAKLPNEMDPEEAAAEDLLQETLSNQKSI